MWAVWILLCAACFTDSDATTTYTNQLMHGSKFTIRLSSGYDTLEYIPVEESNKIILYSKSVSAKRGYVTKVGDHKEFIISSVTFDDQGTYQVRNFWNTLSSVYLLKVVTKTDTYDCVAGETLTIPLGGVNVGDASLSFSGEDFNLTLVDRGSAVGKKHPDYFGRIEVTSQNIKVLKVNVSDVGNYTLTDGLGRTVSVSRMILIDHRERMNMNPFMALLMLLGIPAGVCFCCRKRIFQRRGRTTTTVNTVNFDSLVTLPHTPPAYSDPTVHAPVYHGYPVEGGSTVHPPPQVPYKGAPTTNPDMNPGINPGMNAAVNPPLYPALPQNPAFNPDSHHQNPAYPPAPGFPHVPPPQQSGVPHNPPAPAGFVMCNAPSPAPATAPADFDPSKAEVHGTEISASTPLLPPPQPEVGQPPAPYTGANVLNSTDSPVQFNIDMGKNTGSNFL